MVAKLCMRAAVVVLGCMACWSTPATANSQQKTLQQWLDEAKDHTANQRFSEALDAYEGALAKDPNSYSTWFKRALLYVNLGKTSSAINDFSTVLRIKPDFDQALYQKARLLAMECSLDEAATDLTKYIAHKPDGDAVELLEEIRAVKPKLSEVDSLIKSKNYQQAIEVLSQILTVCNVDVPARLKRARCYVETGDIEMAVSDFRRATKVKPGDTGALQEMAQLQLSLGELSEAVHTIKDCLKQDPDHKACKKLFRQVRKLDKAMAKISDALAGNKWSEVIKLLTASDSGLVTEVEGLGSPALKKQAYNAACRAYGELHDKAALSWCSKVLEIDGNDLDALMYRGEAKIVLEEYEDAMRDLQKAHELDRQNQRIVNAYQKAQKLQRQAGRRDYYKVLGLPRTASKRDIKKAYRKLAQEWHPDKYNGDLPKETVVKKMSEINEAYGVLNDDELRQRFDNGDDPNDQQGGDGGFGGHPFAFHQGPGGFPFGHGGPGGGQPFHFKFNFG